MRECLNAGLSDCCVYGNILLGCAESIAFQVFMLYSLSPPGILISSCQLLTFLYPLAHLSPISTFIIPFLKNHGFFIAHSVPSILLLAHPSVPLLFDVSLILPLSFNHGDFLHLSALLSHIIPLTFHALLSFPLCPSFCLCGMPSPSQNPPPFSSSYFSF